MTDQRFPPDVPHGGTPPARQRALPPGGGNRLLRAYLAFLAMSVVVVIIILPFVLYATISAIGQDNAVTLLVGCVVLTVSFLCLLAALLRGRAAVRDDLVSIPIANTSRLLARTGSLTGWLGAPAVAATGIVQHYLDVDMALLWGIVIGSSALIPAICNDGAYRMARRAMG